MKEKLDNLDSLLNLIAFHTKLEDPSPSKQQELMAWYKMAREIIDEIREEVDN